MEIFKDKVAVITGAASGIGLEIARHCSYEGMKIVLADIREKTLNRAYEELKTAGATVISILTDVSKPGDVEKLAKKTMNTFGEIHLLFNNAGVVAEFGSAWECTLAEWEWVLGVNLWGVIHGIRVFVPIMLNQDSDSHIVNTASTAGLTSGSFSASYGVSKHGVVALSEHLYYQLAEKRIGVSVLCPGSVRTGIMDLEQNRLGKLKKDSATATPENKAKIKDGYKKIQDGISPENVADDVFKAIREKRFYILAGAEKKYKPRVKMRMEDILLDRNPTPKGSVEN